jgi:hypothetical protein
LFADPIADIAVLGTPDDQALPDEAEAYEKLVEGMTPLMIGNAPKMSRSRVRLGKPLKQFALLVRPSIWI